MQAALVVAPAPFCGQLLRAGAALCHAAARLFAAKETSKAAAQDDVSARAAQILDTHGNAILRYAYSYLHNMADAEEVLQDTLVQFLKTAPRFESEAHEKAWLLRVAGNLSKNRLSYNAVRAADELNDELVAENREDLSFVWQAVRDLKHTARQSTCSTTRAARPGRLHRFCSAAKQPSAPICTGAGSCCAKF